MAQVGIYRKEKPDVKASVWETRPPFANKMQNPM